MQKVFTFASALIFTSQISIAQVGTNPVIYLWPNGAPDFENKKDVPKEAKDWWVKNTNNPSLTVYAAPKEKATGAAVIICPRAGQNKLVITSEGKEASEYFNSFGVTAFALKYRLFREHKSPCTMESTLQDGRRAIRVVRQKVKEFNIDTSKIGLMGFWAGGELAA
jgi:acetyl esterase/lipase